jgi:hypothetical protein
MKPDPSMDVVENMAVAFDRLRVSLEVPGCGITEEMLAEKVIAAMQHGLCEPDEIYTRVLKDLLH